MREWVQGSGSVDGGKCGGQISLPFLKAFKTKVKEIKTICRPDEVWSSAVCNL